MLRIAILGDALVGRMAAVRLAMAMGRGDTITLVPVEMGEDGLGPFGDAVMALPEWQVAPIAAGLDLAERRAMRQSFSLGIALGGWRREGENGFLPFGEIGAPIGSVAFHHLAERLRATGQAIRLTDFSLAAMAAQAERFALPGEDPRSPLSTLDFATHISAAGLAAVLGRRATAAGCRTAAAPFRAAQPGEHGVDALLLADESRIEADLFLDCTGSAARLIGDALGEPLESWRHWLPCDRVVTRSAREGAAPPPYALHQARADGWTATTPLAGMRGDAAFFAARADAPADATAFESGVRHRAWRGNCVAIGAAAALIEPLFGAPLLAASQSLDRLAGLLPHRPGSVVEAAAFNRLAISHAERQRDIAVAAYKTNQRVGEPFWDAARAMPVPDSLARKLDLYASRGVVPMYDDEPFEAADWVMMLDAQGLRPRRIDPLAAALSDAMIADHCRRLRGALIAALRTMPRHADFLQQMTPR